MKIKGPLMSSCQQSSHCQFEDLQESDQNYNILYVGYVRGSEIYANMLKVPTIIFCTKLLSLIIHNILANIPVLPGRYLTQNFTYYSKNNRLPLGSVS